MSENAEAKRKARERVKAGIVFLDSSADVVGKDWRGRLNHAALDISNGRFCVVGQLLGHFRDGCRTLGIGTSCVRDEVDQPLASELGFQDDQYCEKDPEAVDFAYLQDAWAEILDEGIPTAAELELEHDYDCSDEEDEYDD